MTDELITKLLEASFSDRVNVALTLNHSSLRELGKDVQQVVDPERKRGSYTGEQMRKVIYGNISKGPNYRRQLEAIREVLGI
ncbi:hypothetical protein E2146_09255 [Oenococcus oeni]|nr:hypothetical protein E2146_09255 [Oenococcus oeni]TEU59022.1 hypothetical protein E2142_02885 [Oenococcus oeni]TEU59257.1 hypothetical protein E2144_08100 [Oenococcus oeni]